MQLVALVRCHRLRQRHAREERGEIVEHLCMVGRELLESCGLAQQSFTILLRQQLHDLHHVTAIDGTEHGARVRFQCLAAAEHDELIEQ